MGNIDLKKSNMFIFSILFFSYLFFHLDSYAMDNGINNTVKSQEDTKGEDKEDESKDLPALEDIEKKNEMDDEKLDGMLPVFSINEKAIEELSREFSELKISDFDYDADDEGADRKPKKKKKRRKKYKKRLFLGEADFSYADALNKKHRKKHPRLAKAIVATEYVTGSELELNYSDTFPTYKKNLKKAGVTLLYEVDARTIHNDPRFKDKRFKRIHFNFPHDLSSYKSDSLPKLIAQFFQSASQLQEVGDRIHMALPYSPWADKRNFRHGYIYGIYRASIRSGYRLLKKRHFTKKSWTRYPGYRHRQTGNSCSVNVTENSREYIFVKERNVTKNKDIDEMVEKFPCIFYRVKNYRNKEINGKIPKYINTRCYKYIKTEDEADSSDYFDSSSEEESDKEGFDEIKSFLTRWYTDDHINRLFDHYFNNLGFGFGRMHAINIRAGEGEVFHQNLNARETQITQFERDAGVNVPHIVIPINLGGYNVKKKMAGNHWVGLYILRHPTVQIWYFDPFGNGMSPELEKQLKRVYPNAEFIINPIRFQSDGYNCGPWIVEILRHLVEHEQLPAENFDILMARINHHNILYGRDFQENYNFLMENNIRELTTRFLPANYGIQDHSFILPSIVGITSDNSIFTTTLGLKPLLLDISNGI